MWACIFHRSEGDLTQPREYQSIVSELSRPKLLCLVHLARANVLSIRRANMVRRDRALCSQRYEAGHDDFDWFLKPSRFFVCVNCAVWKITQAKAERPLVDHAAELPPPGPQVDEERCRIVVCFRGMLESGHRFARQSRAVRSH